VSAQSHNQERSGSGQISLRVRDRLIYGVGSVAFGVKDNGFSYFLHFFYSQVVGLPSATVGLAILFALVVDAFIDPVIGQLSDNLKSRWGRRHPFMYAAAFPAALSYLLLWNPPTGWSGGALIGYLIVTAIMIRTFISCYEIPSTALSAELTKDYDERTKLLSYRYLFGWVGGVTMSSLALLVFLRSENGSVGQLNAQGYQNYGLCAAALMLAAILISAIGTHRFIPSLPKASRVAPTADSLPRQMFATLRHRTFLYVLGASFFNAMGLGLALSINLYFVTYFWEFSPTQIALLGASSLIAAIFAFTIAPRVSAKIDKRPVSIALLITAIIFTVAPVVMRLIGIFPDNGTNLVYVLVFGFNVGSLALGITAQILLSSMIADVVEDSELKTGRRNEGLFFAAAAFVNKAVSGAGIFATSLLIGFVGFPKGALPGGVSAATLQNLGLAYTVIIASLFLAAALMLSGYRITRASHQETLRQLALRNV
jgi:GPH family glycoside/pentoside/hexuronide:cation symporter